MRRSSHRVKPDALLFVSLLFIDILVGGCGGGGGGGAGDTAVDTGATSVDTGTTAKVGVIQGTVTADASVTFAPQRTKPALNGGASFIPARKIPVPDAECMLAGTDKTTRTDQNGAFTFSDVPVGSYIVICKKTASNGNVLAFLSAVDVTENGVTAVGTVEVTPTGSIQGRVTLAGQSDHTGINVYVPGTSYQATTDSLGAYRVNNVPEGLYTLRCEKTGYASADLAVVVTPGAATTAEDVFLDVSRGPSGGISIENGRPYANSRVVKVAITASPDATLMQISENVNFLGSIWNKITVSSYWTFTSDGEKRLYVKFADANGLETSPTSDTIIVDTTPPEACAVVIRDPATLSETLTNTTSVRLALTTTDATTSVSRMMISNSADMADASWVSFQSSTAWTLPSGDGTKTVYVRCKDIVGNETVIPSSASMTLDTIQPVASGMTINDGVAYTNTNAVTLKLTSSGATKMAISEDAAFTGIVSETYNATKTFTLSSGDGAKTVYAKFLDDAGNASSVVSASIVLDKTPPTTPVIFNQSGQTTNNTTFTMTLATASSDANFSAYELMGGQYGAWTATAATGPFAFQLSQQGANTLKVRAKDLAGNIGGESSISVILDTVSPVIGNITVRRTGTTATIAWQTSESTTGNVQYGVNTNYGSTQNDATLATSHSVTLNGLTENTTYHYKIVATDSLNITESVDTTFRTGKYLFGNITANRTLLAVESPYIVTGNIGVYPGVILTIEPGVTVEFTGAYTITVKGSVIANGASSNRIMFKNQVAGTTSGATVLKFAETNLSNSQLSYVTIEDADQAIRVGDESFYQQTNPKNSGTLNASFIEVTRAGIMTNGYTTTAKLILTNATITSSDVLGALASEPIEIKFSTIANSTITSDQYNGGITISDTTVSGCRYIVGDSGGNLNIIDSVVSSCAIDPKGFGGPLQLTRSSLTNTIIDLPSSTAVISNCTVAYNSDYSSLIWGVISFRMWIGNGSFTNSRLTGNGGGVGLNITGRKGTITSGQTFTISNSDITGCDTGILCSGNFSLPISTSNIYGNSALNIDYRNTQNRAATGNYWGVTTSSAVGALIYDGNDDINYGTLDVSTFSATVIPGTGP